MSQAVNNEPFETEETTAIQIEIDAAGGLHIPDFVDLALTGMDERELARILKLRDGYQNGTITEQTQESKRLAFARWLLEHDRLKK